MNLKQYILDLNRRRSEEFCSPEAQDALRLYKECHPTEVLVFKCMDGRINLPLITHLPEGAFQPFRNIGGKFDLGSPLLNDLVLSARHRAVGSGKRLLAIFTYHYSKGDDHRGCAGYNHDTAAAKAGAFALRAQFGRMFGETNQVVSSIVVGIETDEDTIIFHDGAEKTVSIAEHTDASDLEMEKMLRDLYPWMHGDMLRDIFPIALGNRDHVKMIQQQGRQPEELVHGENIIAVGRGFGWLHVPNKALIIGPYDYNWGEAVRVAGRIVSTNIAEGRAPAENGALLLALTPYWDPEDLSAVEEKSRYIAKISESVLRDAYPDLDLGVLVGATDMKTRLIHVFE